MISKADIVVRFNNYATRESIRHTKDRLKCDVLFSTFDLHSHGAKPKDAVIGIPFPFKAEEIYDKPDRFYPESRHWMVDPYENMRMCKELGIQSNGSTHPLPSIGFTALWHMKDWPARFYVCGFSWYYNQSTKKVQGWDIKRIDYPKHWNHNYPKEVLWVMDHLLNKNNFIFSRECYEIFASLRHQLS